MNIQEKQAWYILLVAGLTVGLYLVAGALTDFHFAATGCFGLFGFAGFAGMIGRKEKKAGRVVRDERDTAIEKTATIAGYSILWLALVFAAMVPFFILGPNGEVTVKTPVFCMLLIVAMMLVMSTRALVTVVLYRRASHG